MYWYILKTYTYIYIYIYSYMPFQKINMFIYEGFLKWGLALVIIYFLGF